MRIARDEILSRLDGQIRMRRPIIGAGAGIGLTAICEEQGGADLIIIYNSGRFRMAGRSSSAGRFCYGNANDIMLDMAKEILPVVKHTPVLAGVFASDPFRDIDRLLDSLGELGFSGVQNFPTLGSMDDYYTANLEAAHMGYSVEADMIRKAHKLGLLTTPYCFNKEQIRQMADAGADLVVIHAGLTASGMTGAKSFASLDDTVEYVGELARVAKECNPNLRVICHGGVIVGPKEVAYILEQIPQVCGFYGASSVERIPAEKAITKIVREFKNVRILQ